jgi:hypothetical protein
MFWVRCLGVTNTATVASNCRRSFFAELIHTRRLEEGLVHALAVELEIAAQNAHQDGTARETLPHIIPVALARTGC